MPLSHFKTYYYGDGPSSFAWSVSFGYRLTEDAIHVTMVRKSDGRVWNFSSDQADGDFYVNNTGYGIIGCVIFRPSGVGAISAGDAFDVSIANDKDHTILQYSVTFFSL